MYRISRASFGKSKVYVLQRESAEGGWLSKDYFSVPGDCPAVEGKLWFTLCKTIPPYMKRFEGMAYDRCQLDGLFSTLGLILDGRYLDLTRFAPVADVVRHLQADVLPAELLALSGKKTEAGMEWSLEDIGRKTAVADEETGVLVGKAMCSFPMSADKGEVYRECVRISCYEGIRSAKDSQFDFADFIRGMNG